MMSLISSMYIASIFQTSIILPLLIHWTLVYYALLGGLLFFIQYGGGFGAFIAFTHSFPIVCFPFSYSFILSNIPHNIIKGNCVFLSFAQNIMANCSHPLKVNMKFHTQLVERSNFGLCQFLFWKQASWVFKRERKSFSLRILLALTILWTLSC